jgi:hypothetical protein
MAIKCSYYSSQFGTTFPDAYHAIDTVTFRRNEAGDVMAYIGVSIYAQAPVSGGMQPIGGELCTFPMSAFDAVASGSAISRSYQLLIGLPEYSGGIHVDANGDPT